MTGRIVVLNGCSSAGKTSLAKAIQAIARDEAFLHVELDAFRAMEPPDYFEMLDTGLRKRRLVALCRAIDRAAIAFAESGQNVIVDHVLDPAAWKVLLEDFASQHAMLVRVDCALERVEARERARADRREGLARGQIEAIHRGREYDFAVDTTATSAESLATAVLAWLRTDPQPRAIAAMRQGAAA